MMEVVLFLIALWLVVALWPIVWRLAVGVIALGVIFAIYAGNV